MTEPLTPPECDLQDFPFMPLHVARLRDSDLAGEEKPEACWYAVLLWCASWHQLPAGSLPDNESVLARLCGLGRDLRTFRKHRAAAMRGFVLCDDGRLYHPVVAEQARSAWESKLQQRWRTECARIKKANQRHGTDNPMPTFEVWLSSQVPDPSPESVPRDARGTGRQCPSGNGIQETGTGIVIPFSNENGALPNSDAAFWATAKAYLGKGKASLIGQWVRDYGKQETASAITAAQLDRAVEPVEFIQKRLRGVRKQPAVPL